ncbi:hypothetical protein RBSWK_04161 [Rhodopirellula baltica SWK14]|uniref:Uncharacterized protein n=1 Tax=Rhodopirellula baltica SWK14 TaxID=993516 RepID=L7CG26_RHOBT|nr:hypothetical protein RBSWK_04161 [Rhodopirellula baltica SWK14]
MGMNFNWLGRTTGPEPDRPQDSPRGASIPTASDARSDQMASFFEEICHVEAAWHHRQQTSRWTKGC